jgi:hypothetical protein
MATGPAFRPGQRALHTASRAHGTGAFFAGIGEKPEIGCKFHVMHCNNQNKKKKVIYTIEC